MCRWQGPKREGAPALESALQRLEPVADLIRLHDAGHQAVIGSPSSAAATMTGIEGTSVLRGSGLHVS